MKSRFSFALLVWSIGVWTVSGATVFEARFESPGSLAADVGTLTLTNANASHVSVDGNHSQLDWGTGALFTDSAASPTQGPGYGGLWGLTQAVDLDGATVSFEYVHRRSQSPDLKSHFVTAYDRAGRIVFQIMLVDLDRDLGKIRLEQRQIPGYLDRDWGQAVFSPLQIASGDLPDSQPDGNGVYTIFFKRDGRDTTVNESLAGRFVVMTTDTGWSLSATPSSSGATLNAFSTIEIPFVDPSVRDIFAVVISGESDIAGGFWDNLQVTGSPVATEAKLLLSSTPNPATTILEQDTANSFTRAFDPDHNSNRGDRGQSFRLPDISGSRSVWRVSSISVYADAARDFTTFPNAKVKLSVFAWPNAGNATDLSSWNDGDGVSDGDPFDGTGINRFLVGEVEVPINVNITGGQRLEFCFPRALQLKENTAYGMLLAIDDGASNPGSGSNLQLDIFRDSTAPNGAAYPDGNFLGVTQGGESGTQGTDDLRFVVTGKPEPLPPIRFNPERNVGPTVARWGWDLKGNRSLVGSANAARQYFVDLPANLIRIPVLCDAHYSNGTIETNEYTSIINGLHRIMNANTNVEVFASLKLEGANTFVGPPSESGWITAGSAEWPFAGNGQIFGNTVAKPNPVHYAKVWADFFDHFRANGITINYVGLNNESEGALDAARYFDTYDRFKALLTARGHDVSQIKFIAPEGFDPHDSLAVLEEYASQSRLDTVDIIGTHAYPTHSNHTRDLWRKKRSAAGNTNLWHTEIHMNPATTGNGVPFAENTGRMRQGMAVLFAANMEGVDSFVWWQGGTSTANIDKILKRKLVLTMTHATPVASPYFDEHPANADTPLYQAYRQGGQLWLWLANPSNADLTRSVELVEGFLSNPGSVTGEYWAGPGNIIGDTATTGSVTLNVNPTRKSLTVDLPANSIALINVPYRGTQPIEFAFRHPGLALEQDASNNGIPNFLQYAAGYDPTAAVPSPLQFISRATSNVTYTHSQSSQAEDVIVEYEYRTALGTGSWQTLNGTHYENHNVNPVTSERNEISFALKQSFMTANPRVFLRTRFRLR